MSEQLDRWNFVSSDSLGAPEVPHAASALGGGDADRAVDVWRGLVDGQWSLVDRFDAGARRHLLAQRSSPGAAGHSGLTGRERLVVQHAARACPYKVMASELGLAVSTIGSDLSSALKKLGLCSQAELVLSAGADWAPSDPAPPPGLESTPFGSDDFVVLTYPLPEVDLPACLSPAEREIALLLVRGWPYKDIAAKRCRSTRTVANQVRSVFGKLRVGSRAGLALRVRGAAFVDGPRPVNST
jgi:DNA-binding NarL/FixJ family response regulator